MNWRTASEASAIVDSMTPDEQEVYKQAKWEGRLEGGVTVGIAWAIREGIGYLLKRR
jgi:hypothetical protein